MKWVWGVVVEERALCGADRNRLLAFGFSGLFGFVNLDEFLESVEADKEPSSDLPMALQGLWWDRKGDWEKAHDCCQPPSDGDTDWLHAYLHRKEGDLGNAGYWYSRSGKPVFEGALDEEWGKITTALLEKA